VAPSAETFGSSQGARGILKGGRQNTSLGGLRVEWNYVELVRVASVVHWRVAKHAIQANVDQICRISRLGLCLCLDLRVLVDVRHGGNGVAAGACPREAGHGGGPRRGLGDEGRPTSMHAPEGRSHSASSAGPAKRTRPWIRHRRRFCSRRARFRVEQNGAWNRGRLVLSDDDAAIAGELEVNLWQRAIVRSSWREGSAMERVGLAVGVVEGTRIGIEQVSRVGLFRGRIKRRGG
jgi:hypothetical protein